VALDVTYYKNAFHNVHIDKIFPFNLIMQIMNGFLWTNHTGIACLVSTSDGIVTFNDSFAIQGTDTVHNCVCEAYKKLVNVRTGCKESDEAHFLKCIESNVTAGHTYSCWLGFQEVACPLTVDGKVRAILLAGQLIPKRDGKIDPIDLDRIKKQITTNISNLEHQASLFESLEKEVIKQTGNITLSEEMLLKNLKELQLPLQQIMDHTFAEYKSATTSKLLQEASNYLTELDPPTQEEWWNDCSELLNDFCNILELKQIHVFSRKGGRYRLKTPVNELENKYTAIESRLVMQSSKKEQIINFEPSNPQHKDFLEKLKEIVPLTGEMIKQIHVYRNDTAYHQDTYSTLMIIVGDIPDHLSDLITQFCKTISTRFTIVGLIYRILENHAGYKERVGLVAHSFRTPLACVALDLAYVQDCLNGKDEYSRLYGRIINSIQRVKDTKEDLDYLLDSIRDTREDFNLIQMTNNMMAALNPYAKAHPCTIQWKIPPPDLVVVRGNQNALWIGLQSIIENAIKYSFENKDVNIWVTCSEKQAILTVSNYGIGMSLEFIKDVLEGKPGTRLDAKDWKERPGTGWGIPTAKRMFSDNDGWFDIESKPADSGPREPGEEYHRFITYAYAGIPLAQ
jgi:ligand-binding sensor protein